MPDVNIQATLTVTKSNSMLQGVGSWDITQQTSTKRNCANIQNVTTAAAALPIGSVNPLGYLFVKNLGTVNVSLGLASGSQTFATVRPSEFCLVPTATNTIYAWTASSNADVQIVAAES
jgi:hypothetical protein